MRFLRSTQFSRRDDSYANSNIAWWWKPYVHINNKVLLKFRENIWDERGRDISKGTSQKRKYYIQPWKISNHLTGERCRGVSMEKEEFQLQSWNSW